MSPTPMPDSAAPPPIAPRQAFAALVRAVCHTYPRRTAAVLVLGLAKGVSEGLALLVLLPILALFGIGDAGRNGIVIAIRDGLAATGLPLTLAVGLSLVVVLGIASAAVGFAQTALAARLVRSFVRDLQIDTYGRLIEAGSFYLVRQKLGDSLGLLIKFAEKTGNGITVLFRATTDVILVLVMLGVAIWQSAAYVGLVAVIAAIAGLPLIWHFRRVGRLVAATNERTRGMHAAVGDHLKLAFTIRAFGAQKESRRHVAAEIGQASRLLESLAVQAALARAFLEPAVLLLLCVTIWFGIAVFAISTDRLMLLVLIFLRLVPRLVMLSTYAQQGTGFASAYAQLLTIQNEAAAATPGKGTVPPDWPRLTQAIRLDRVTVALDGETLLDGVDLAIPPRGVTAVLGPSGAGKSTLIAAVLGLVPPTGGRVLVEGADLASLRGDAWRQRLGFVGQDTPLFHASLRENLAFAAPGADDAAMVAAMAQAGLGPFLDALPQGLDTVVGEGGSRMSGGERQRLALARALLRRPLLLVLDEPTSALDWETAERLLATVEELGHALPVLMVTHDLHLARAAASIYVLDAGRVVEQGSWAALSAGEGRLAAFRQIRSAG